MTILYALSFNEYSKLTTRRIMAAETSNQTTGAPTWTERFTGAVNTVKQGVENIRGRVDEIRDRAIEFYETARTTVENIFHRGETIQTEQTADMADTRANVTELIVAEVVAQDNATETDTRRPGTWMDGIKNAFREKAGLPPINERKSTALEKAGANLAVAGFSAFLDVLLTTSPEQKRAVAHRIKGWVPDAAKILLNIKEQDLDRLVGAFVEQGSDKLIGEVISRGVTAISLTKEEIALINMRRGELDRLRQDNKKGKNNAEIKALEQELEAYKIDYGKSTSSRAVALTFPTMEFIITPAGADAMMQIG
ncbi:MAG: hypothetical protein Fur003_3240 [Candidatus Dojkabacteria bacterium]